MSCLRVIVALLTLICLPAQAVEERLIVFYDPDGNHQAILSIASAFNQYMQENGLALRLQPVTTTQRLEDLMKTAQVEYVIVSSAYLKEHSTLRPLLVPESRGETYYRKILFDRAGTEPSNLAGKNIATTVGEGRSHASLLAMLKKGGVSVDGAHLIPVAKDIDALLALTFGQVQAALVTQNSVDILQRINPTAAQSLRKLFETEKILRSPLCAVGSSRPSDQALIDALRRMNLDAKGKLAMSSLGFDRWVPYVSGDAR